MGGGSKMSKRARLYESESEEMMSEEDSLQVFSCAAFCMVLRLF